jgi:hypothetical protein
MPKEREKIHAQLEPLAVQISTLVPDPHNARKHDARNVDAIAESLREHGQRKPVVAQKVGDTLVVRAGNGTLQAAKKLGWKRLAVLVVEEDDREATRFALRDNRTAELAEWDDEALRKALRECAENEAEIAALGWNPDEFQVEEGQASPADTSTSDSPYTAKIKAPIYEPTGAKPSTDMLFDRGKTDRLLAEIASADLPDKVRSFLRFAAERHTVFNYRQIAEFYAHADEKTQGLMEASALVIIDFDKAIEHGFVRLTERLGNIVGLTPSEDESDA